MKSIQIFRLLEAAEKNYQRKNKNWYILHDDTKRSACAIMLRHSLDETACNEVSKKVINDDALGCYSEENLRKFIQSILPAPVRVEYPVVTAKQRRMDSLARLLAPREIFTPCIATAIDEGELIIASNPPKGMTTADDISHMVGHKLKCVRQFLESLVHSAEKNLLVAEEIDNIKFTALGEQRASETIDQIISRDFGGYANVTAANPKHDRNTPKGHLKNALLKLGQDVLLGVYTDGRVGFTIEERTALLSNPEKILIPRYDVKKGTEHAEQVISLHLQRKRSSSASSAVEKTYIGISKLCCQACARVLKNNPLVQFRGESGVGFPNVYDVQTKKCASFVKTKTEGYSLNPSDSESDFEVELPNYDELSKLSVSELMGKAEVAQKKLVPSVSIAASHRLFKSYSVGGAGEEGEPSDAPVAVL